MMTDFEDERMPEDLSAWSNWDTPIPPKAPKPSPPIRKKLRRDNPSQNWWERPGIVSMRVS